jgi:CRISPR/Cas system CMR-associated protein Cmr3 (group 5 of RAMP superfamily)
VQQLYDSILETVAKKLNYFKTAINTAMYFKTPLYIYHGTVSSQLKRLERMHDINRDAKVQIYKTLIRPVVTYGCESWTMKKEDVNIL